MAPIFGKRHNFRQITAVWFRSDGIPDHSPKNRAPIMRFTKNRGFPNLKGNRYHAGRFLLLRSEVSMALAYIPISQNEKGQDKGFSYQDDHNKNERKYLVSRFTQPHPRPQLAGKCLGWGLHQEFKN